MLITSVRVVTVSLGSREYFSGYRCSPTDTDIEIVALVVSQQPLRSLESTLQPCKLHLPSRALHELNYLND